MAAPLLLRFGKVAERVTVSLLLPVPDATGLLNGAVGVYTPVQTTEAVVPHGVTTRRVCPPTWKETMKIQRVRGTRDFYPEDVVVRNWLFDAWRRVSIRNGFVEYDGPLLEYMDLYRAKSGEELVGQLFAVSSRGGEELAIRPEMTPTLARMINARVQSLSRPIKWFTIGPFYRGERPQRGRLREFYQWNIDVVGSEELLADAECIFVAVDLLRELGLTAQDVVVRINDRRLMTAIFDAFGIPAELQGQAMGLVDKAEKMEPSKLAAAWDEVLGSVVRFERFDPLLSVDSLDALRDLVGLFPPAGSSLIERQIDELSVLLTLLQDFGITEYCNYSMRIIRGLAYYTGPVFEAFDRRGQLRALCGGGRYDNLLEVLGGPNVSGVGFGMGDVVLTELLSDLGRLPGSRKTGRDWPCGEASGQGGVGRFQLPASGGRAADSRRVVARGGEVCDCGR
jgi:histidyl-tRNA synthetase